MVFADRDGDGRRGRFERGLRGVAVSNGRDVVRTDWRGRYALPVGDDAFLFVVKPRGWAVPAGPDGVPRFYHAHKPAGSPPGLRYPGVPPTGPLPESVDFPLLRQREPDVFQVVLLADPQPYREAELDFLARDVIAGLVGVEAAFGLVLGDLVGDDLSLFEPLDRLLASTGIPWYRVHGNHDMNLDADGDAHSDESFERAYGPTTYAFQYGPVHFVVLDDVVYEGARPDGSAGAYAGGLLPQQLAFLRAYLAGVPRHELVVLAMHIPLAGPTPHEVPQRRELFEVLARHPHTFSVSGHTHIQEHHFFGAEDGWPGPGEHHHLNQGTASGSWWRGAPDEHGIPHATMRCGAPNGHAIARFEGHRYRVRFQAARRPADHQMAIHAPAVVEAARSGETEVLVNVFAGSERSRVEMRLGPDGAWLPLRPVRRRDPGYAASVAREAEERPPHGYGLPPAVISPHLFAGHLPDAPAPGAAVLEVRVVDEFGQLHRARRPLRIE